MADNRPRTIDECAQIAYDAIMRRTGGDVDLADIMRRAVRDAYRTGANRALEDAAQTVESVAPDAARHIRDQKQPEEPTPALTPVERRTQRPTAQPLQAAADILRTETDPRWHDVAEHLDVTADEMAWLAPYRDHETGARMWYSAVSLAHTILTEETGRG
ncbi:hypothetical protein [Nocardiopsis alba]|uniref:hypothetical protein n=1 Tax=Nocardiopsis alba TaxID=53437 RepID=UPI003D749632